MKNKDSILENPIKVEGKKVDLEKFSSESKKRLGLIRKGIETQKNVTELIDLTRAAIAVSAGYNDLSMVEYLISSYNIVSGEILRAGGNMPLENFSVINYWSEEKDSEKTKERLIKDFLPKILRTIKIDEQYKGLSEVFSREGGNEDGSPKIYQTKDNQHYLIAAEEVNPKDAGLEKAVSESQKLIRIPKLLADSILHL